jgi:uncharacterized protein YcfJ
MIHARATAAARFLRSAGLAALAVATVAACANQTAEERRLTGQVAGGVAGAVVGSQFGGGSGRLVATGAGAVLGAIAGGAIAE